MKKYSLTGIDYPGTVDLPKIGKVNLVDLPEETLDKLYADGIPFLELNPETREYFNPAEPAMRTSQTPIKKKTYKKPA